MKTGITINKEEKEAILEINDAENGIRSIAVLKEKEALDMIAKLLPILSSSSLNSLKYGIDLNLQFGGMKVVK
jgi:hypothetical protein